jgi:tRNA C32,U32 (ribose-2'-O)-methylase TrmJ
MAAGVLLYDLYQFTIEAQSLSTSLQPKPVLEPLPSHGEREHLVAYALRALEGTQFFKYPDSESVAARLRRLLQQSSWSKGDLLFVFEMIYQLKSKADGNYGERNFFSASQSNSKNHS